MTTDVVFTPPYHQLSYSVTSSTYSIMTADTCNVLGSQHYGWGYMSVEVKNDAGGDLVVLWGIGEQQVGPLYVLQVIA